MRYRTVSREDLLKARREQSDSERRGERISNTSHLARPGVEQPREWPQASAADWLCLGAAPTFALMALLTGFFGGERMICATAPDASPLTGMAAMYVLMSAFHLTPWLKLIFGHRHHARRS